MGKLCKNDIVGIFMIFTLAMSIYFIELKFIYMGFFAYCYIRDFKIMMTQVIK